MTTIGSESPILSPLDALLQGAPRHHRDLLNNPVLRVIVTGRDSNNVMCRIISTEMAGRIPIDNLAGGRYDARRERLESLKPDTVLRVHFGFDRDGRLIFDERQLYNEKVFEAFPLGKSVRLRISRANPAIGLHLRYNLGDGRFHDVFIPRAHLRRSVSTYPIGQRLTAEVIIALDEGDGDLTVILSERADNWRRLCALSKETETTVKARYRGFKHGSYQFAVLSFRGSLLPSDLPSPLTTEQLTVGGWVNVRMKSFVDGQLMLTRRGVNDEPPAQ